MDINNATFTGRLTRDVTTKTLSTGTKLVTFDMANNTGFGDNEIVTYLTVNLWGKTGDTVSKYLVKGKQVGVTGSIKLDTWTGSDGLEHKKIILNCFNIVLFGGITNDVNKPSDDYEDYASSEVVNGKGPF